MTDVTPYKFRQRLLAIHQDNAARDRREKYGYRSRLPWEERLLWEKYVLGSKQVSNSWRNYLPAPLEARYRAYTKSWLERKCQEDLNKPEEEKKKKKKKKRKAEGKMKKRKLSPPLKKHEATAEQDLVKGFHKLKIINSEAFQDGQVVIFNRFPKEKITKSEAVQDDQDVVLRLQAESERLKEVGPLAYYSEWVEAWKRDTSREAVQKHFEDTGEDEDTQLIEMFTHQTDREYRVMLGTDTLVRGDPLAMRMREDQVKQIWGGDPVYPTVNYIQGPDEVIDFRGPDFHEPTPNMLSYLEEVFGIV